MGETVIISLNRYNDLLKEEARARLAEDIFFGFDNSVSLSVDEKSLVFLPYSCQVELIFPDKYSETLNRLKEKRKENV